MIDVDDNDKVLTHRDYDLAPPEKILEVEQLFVDKDFDALLAALLLNLGNKRLLNRR